MTSIDGTYMSSSFGLLGRLVADSTKARGAFDRLTAQSSSGRIADTYAGLGAGAGTSLDLRPQIASITTWQKNIDASATRMKVAETAMESIQGVASDLLAELNNLNGLSAVAIDAAAANARSALAQVSSLLNTRAGGVYVFSGQDNANPPVPDGENITSSDYFAAISATVSGLAANGAAATAASTLAIAVSDSPGETPFSTYLSQPSSAVGVPTVQTGPGQTVAIGMLANANVAVPSQGSETTGSYMRDLMRALATVGSLSSSQMNDPGFNDLVQNTRVSLTRSIATMANEVGVIGDRYAALQKTSDNLEQMSTALSAQLNIAENVDMAETLSNLSAVQTQLQASYQLIVNANAISLTKYLG